MNWTGYAVKSVVYLSKRNKERHVNPELGRLAPATTFESGEPAAYEVEVIAIRPLYRIMSIYYRHV
jgi:hypothetical protein